MITLSSSFIFEIIHSNKRQLLLLLLLLLYNHYFSFLLLYHFFLFIFILQISVLYNIDEQPQRPTRQFIFVPERLLLFWIHYIQPHPVIIPTCVCFFFLSACVYVCVCACD